MRKKKNYFSYLILITLVIFMTSSLLQTTAIILNDGANDILHIVDDVYQETVDVHDEIDIDSIEITSTNVFLTLHAAPNTLEHRRYWIEIYWNDIVEEPGFNFYKNQTKCILDFETNEVESKAWNAENESAGSATVFGGAMQNGNLITWAIEISIFHDHSNPKTIFVKMIYSETLEIAFPTGVIEEWLDYYPEDSQTYSDVASFAFLGITISSLLAIVILNKSKKKK